MMFKYFIRQKQSDYFSLRLKIIGGELTCQQLITIHNIAEKFGRGYVHLSARQGVEIPFIHSTAIDTVKKILAQNNFQINRLSITACNGNVTCRAGLIDTQTLAKKFYERYGERNFPPKFKIGFTGCPHNCMKVEQNNLGIQGAMKPNWHSENCKFCGACQTACKQGAVHVDKTVTIDFDKCIYCGKCVKVCSTHAMQGEIGFMFYLGGEKIFPIIFGEDNLFASLDNLIAVVAPPVQVNPNHD